MTIALIGVTAKHERRLRLVFSQTLASGAFGVPAPSFYVITNLDSRGSTPAVAAAMLVTGDLSVVELALASDLVVGAAYSISAIGVPAADTSVTDSTNILTFQLGKLATLRNVEAPRLGKDDLLYGVDLLWNGEDYQETAAGDLDRIGGTANVSKALYRGLEAQGLTWDNTYGANLRQYVDSPSPTSGTMKGAVTAQALRDPRVKKVKVDITTDDANTYVTITPTLVSGADIKPVSLVTPNGS
jgi:hypothetical protein